MTCILTPHGFFWNGVKIERLFSPPAGGICIGVQHKDRKNDIQIYVSPTGKSIRVFASDGKKTRELK